MPLQLLSVVLFGKGFLTGITLTAMLGPVTMFILRSGMQVNRVAGLWAAIGTWISDIVFIAGTYLMTASLRVWVERPDVRFWIYMIGGAGLVAMGIWMLKTKKNNSESYHYSTAASYTQAFAGGFLVNSLSPFTLFFWIGAAFVLRMQHDNPVWYYAGLMLSLGLGDFAKAWMAPKISSWIKEKYVYWIQLIAGIAIAITGLYIIVQGFLEN
ncbi:MAG TPA: LysE family transporter [Saprospiraceae bacterium]|nr:LysE family transporter [Saprospiraceae bacterium]